MSDTTEVLGGAPSASEDAPVGNSAPPAAAGGTTVPTSKSRSRGGTGLSSLLLPELQRMAQSMGIQGAGRMRKGQLVEAIQARQAGTGIANQGSDQRVASAGADSTRLRKQDGMEPATQTQPGIGDGAAVGIGASARGGIGTDEAEGPAQQQLSFDQPASTGRSAGRAPRTQRAQAEQGPTQQAPAEQTGAQPSGSPQTAGQPAGAQPAEAQESGGAPQDTREHAQPG
ncbi:MAG TPA: Rho termination factor N-terminal domain-containing protein, partial [Streptosporangiaceae bacterium]